MKLHATGLTVKRQSKCEMWNEFNLGRTLFSIFADYDRYVADLLCQVIRNNQTVVEYGCGDGLWLEYLAKLYPNKKFVGVEWNQTLMEYARDKRFKNLSNIKLYHEDATKFCVDCDCYFSLGVVEHFSNATDVIRAWTEHLSPNGFAVIMVPNLLNTLYASERARIRVEDLLGKDEVVVGAYGYEELWSHNTFVKKVMDAGLELLMFKIVEEIDERPQLIVGFKRPDSHILGTNLTVNSKIHSFNPLDLPKYAAQGVVHPDVLYFPEGVDGYKYWMVYTPYPPNNLERPCIVRSNDEINWVDSGITNPVVNGGGKNNADPDMCYISELNKWFMAYVQWFDSDTQAKINIAYSLNGKNWTIAGTVIDGNASYEKNNVEKAFVHAPTMIYEDGWFYVWYTVPNKETLLNNRQWLCLAKFQWDNENNKAVNFQRDIDNPIFYPPEDSEFESGLGHPHVAFFGETYFMCAVRKGRDAYEVVRFISGDKKSWVNKGKVLSRGERQPKYSVYRTSTVTDGKGKIVPFKNKIDFYYSTYDVDAVPQIGHVLLDMPFRQKDS